MKLTDKIFIVFIVLLCFALWYVARPKYQLQAVKLDNTAVFLTRTNTNTGITDWTTHMAGTGNSNWVRFSPVRTGERLKLFEATQRELLKQKLQEAVD